MTQIATYEQSHLVVAAVRVLSHQLQHPPTPEEIAELLSQSQEWTRVVIGALVDLGILAQVDSAFTQRVEVQDFAALESLPKEHEAPGIHDEMRDFAKKKKSEEEQLGKLFEDSKAFRKQRQKEMDALADGLKSYKDKKPSSHDLFKDDPEQS